MQRVLLRVSALAAVVVFGVIAIAQAQRGMRSESSPDEAERRLDAALDLDDGTPTGVDGELASPDAIGPNTADDPFSRPRQSSVPAPTADSFSPSHDDSSTASTSRYSTDQRSAQNPLRSGPTTTAGDDVNPDTQFATPATNLESVQNDAAEVAAAFDDVPDDPNSQFGAPVRAARYDRATPLSSAPPADDRYTVTTQGQSELPAQARQEFNAHPASAQRYDALPPNAGQPMPGSQLPAAPADPYTSHGAVTPQSSAQLPPTSHPVRANDYRQPSPNSQIPQDAIPPTGAPDARLAPAAVSPEQTEQYGDLSFTDSATSSEGGRSLREGTGRPGDPVLDGPQAPTVWIRKIAPDEVQVGKPATFAIVVRNAGGVPAHGVEIRDVIPEGTRYIDSTPAAEVGANGDLVWRLGTLSPDDEETVELNLMPTEEGEIGSVATVRLQAECAARTIATRPQLAVDVEAINRVLIGEDVDLVIRVANTGSGIATGVVLEADLPDELEHPAGHQLEYEIGDLAPNQSRDLTLTVTSANPGRVQPQIVARADGDVEDVFPLDMEILSPALQVAIEGPRRRFLEREAKYTLAIGNPGTAPAEDVELIAKLPVGLQFVEADHFGEFDEATRTVIWSLEELPSGDEGVVALTALPVDSGPQVIQVEATSRLGLEAVAEHAVSVEGVPAILFEVVDLADPIEAGSETTYEIRVVNQGTKAASNVRVLVALPGQMEPVAAEGPSRHAVQGTRIVFDPLPRLAPKADTTFRVRARGTAPGDLRVNVQVMTDDIDQPITKEESTRVYSDQ